MSKDYLDAFTSAVSHYGDDLTLQTPSESVEELYMIELNRPEAMITVGTPYLASTLYAFMDALEMLEDQGVVAIEPEETP